MDIKKLFTTDEEFEELEDCDATTRIVGYIDTIIAPHMAGKMNELLFKFIISNESKRIEVLIWKSELIDKHIKCLLSNRVVDINGAFCKALINSRPREAQKLIPYEIIIKENTEIICLGYYYPNKLITEAVQKVTFENVHAVEGRIEISGYVRTKFALIHNRNGKMTYGIGAITDQVRKITIQIKQFVASTLEIGDYVTVTGSVTGEDALVTIVCDSMNDVIFHPEKEALSQEDVRRGGRPVKRARVVDKS